MELLKTKENRLIVLILLVISSTLTLSSQEADISNSINISAAYGFPNNLSYNTNSKFIPVSYSPILGDTNLGERNLGNSIGSPSGKVDFSFDLKSDFLKGNSPLTKDNNMVQSADIIVSPVDITLSYSNTITPIAFLKFGLGTSLSTGWKAIGVNGLALYNSSLGPKEDPFQGVYSRTYINGTFQFDTAAVLSGDKTWKHIVLQTSHNLVFNYFSGATEGESWIYQGVDKYFNGFKYEQSSFIGYQMPLLLDTVGILYESYMNIFDNSSLSKLETGGWGSDFIENRIGLAMNFKVNDSSSLTVLPQIRTQVRYTDETVKDSYFVNRKASISNPWYWELYRVALSYTYNL